MNEENKNVEKIKIIIVDDDKFLLSMYALKFKNKGYEVEVALGGEEAINKIKAGCHPDIIISDVIMPKMDGFEFVEKVKNENLAPKAVYVILTNQGQTTDIEIYTREMLRVRDNIFKIISEHTGKPVEEIAKDAERDYWMTANEAKNYGLIDTIYTKREKPEKK